MIQELRIGPKPSAIPYSMMRLATLNAGGSGRKSRTRRRPSETRTPATTMPMKGVQDRHQGRDGIERQQESPPALDQGVGQDQVQVDDEGEEEPDEDVEDDGARPQPEARSHSRGDPEGGHITEKNEHIPALVARPKEEDDHRTHQPEREREKGLEREAPVPRLRVRGETDLESPELAAAPEPDQGAPVLIETGEEIQRAVALELFEREVSDGQNLILDLEASARILAGGVPDRDDLPGVRVQGERQLPVLVEIRVIEARRQDEQRHHPPEKVGSFP
jgi:hypothetical protein